MIYTVYTALSGPRHDKEHSEGDACPERSRNNRSGGRVLSLVLPELYKTDTELSACQGVVQNYRLAPSTCST